MKINPIANIKKNDPGAFVLTMVAKVAIVMIIYCSLALTLNLPHEVIVWTLYFLSFVAMACAVGDIGTRRKIFLLFLIGFSLILSFSEPLHRLNEFALIIVLIVATYGAFWLRKFGVAFRLFPGYLVIVLALSSMQLPITNIMIPYLILSLFFSGGLFFLLALLWLPWDTPSQLKKLLRNNMFEIQSTMKQVFNCIGHKKNNISGILEAQNAALERANIMQNKGSSWIITEQRKELWHINCSHYMLSIRYLFRLLTFYNMIMLKPSQRIKAIAKDSTVDEVLLLAIILPTWAINLKLEQDFEKQWLKFDRQKLKFKTFVLTQEKETKGCHTLLFDMVLLLESLAIIAKKWRKDINALA